MLLLKHTSSTSNEHGRLQDTQTTGQDPHIALLHHWSLQSNSKALGLGDSRDLKTSVAPAPPNWQIQGSQFPKTWAWVGLTSLSRVHMLTHCFSPLPAEWKGKQGGTKDQALSWLLLPCPGTPRAFITLVPQLPENHSCLLTTTQ